MKKTVSVALKLILILTTVLVVFFLGLTIFVVGRMDRALDEQVEKNMENIGLNVALLCEAAYDVSIKNYLRAIVDSNYDVVAFYYQQYQEELLTEEEAIAAAKKVLLIPKIGKTGYLFVWDVSGAPERVNLIIHPVIGREANLAKHQFVQDSVKMGNGYLEYDWKNPGEDVARSKSMYFRRFEPWQVQVCASSYTDEFSHLVDISTFRDHILAVRITESDYTTVLAPDGTVLIHPYLEGKNISGLQDIKGKMFIKDALDDPDGEGWTSYWWQKSKDDPTQSRKIAYYKRARGTNWLVFVSAYYDDLFREVDVIRNKIALIMIVALLVIITIMIIVSRLLLRPLGALRTRLEEIASGEGDLTTKTGIRSNDEIGALAGAFDRFTGTLQGILNNVKERIGDSSGISTRLKEMSGETEDLVSAIKGKVDEIHGRFGNLNRDIQNASASTRQITEGVVSLADLIEDQAASVNESSATIEEISSSIGNISRITVEKERTARDLVEITNVGGRFVRDTNSLIQGVNQDAERILEMVEIINGIADQTNILAMNAAIEAAHAGEAGKGFSVVADEIRKLAETTSENSRSITANVQSVTGKIREALSLSNSTGDSFNRIHDEVEATSTAFAEITLAMKELALSSEEILKAVLSLNGVTEKVRTGSEEMKISTETVTGTMFNLSQFSSSVTGDLDRIIEEIGRIRALTVDLEKQAELNRTGLDQISGQVGRFKT
jgi:methyl-accepting chemotaxis protein